MSLTSATLYTATRQTSLTSAETAALFVGPLRRTDRYGDPPELVTRSFAFAPDADALVKRATLRLLHTDLQGRETVTWWRLVRTEETIGQGGDLEIECMWRPLWLDLAEALSREATAPGGDLSLRLTGRSPSSALGAVLSSANGAPSLPAGGEDEGDAYRVGTVASGLAASVDLVLDGATVLEAVEALAASAGAEVAFRVEESPFTASQDVYRVDLRPPTSSVSYTATVHLTGQAGEVGAPAYTLTREDSAEDALTAITPQAGGGVGSPADYAGSATLARNRWVVSEVTTLGGGEAGLVLGRRAYPPPGTSAPVVVWEADALEGYTVEVLEVASGSTGVGDVLPITGATVPNVVHVSTPAYTPTAVRIRDANENPAVTLESPSLTAALGRIERAVTFDGSSGTQAVTPYPNLLTQARHPGGAPAAADLSAWDAGLPRGFSSVGSPTVTETTTAANVRFGTSSASVVAADTEGLEVSLGGLTLATAVGVGAHAWVRVVSGTVAIQLVHVQDGTGTETVVIEAEASATAEDVTDWKEPAVAVSSDKLPSTATTADDVRVRLVASGGAAEWVLDSLTATDVPQAVPYTPHMGPEALWDAAARRLSAYVSGTTERVTAEFADRVAMEKILGQDVRVGELVRLRFAHRATGTVRQVDLRCNEVEYEEGPANTALGMGPGGRSVVTRAQFGDPVPSLRDALAGPAAPPPTPTPSIAPPTLTAQLGGASGSYSVELEATPGTATAPSSLRFYRALQPGGPYTYLGSTAASGTSAVTYTDTDVEDGDAFWYVAVARYTSGAESGYSDEAAVLVPLLLTLDSVGEGEATFTVTPSAHPDSTGTLLVRYDTEALADAETGDLSGAAATYDIGTATTYTATGLTDGEEDFWRAFPTTD